MKTQMALFVCTLLATTQLKSANISVFGVGTYSQDFNSLASSGTGNAWANDGTLPGWHLFKQPAPGTAITTYAGGGGTSTPGGFYSFGSAAGDRALGGIGTGAYFGTPAAGAVAGWLAVAFVNDSGGALDNFTAGWNGEQWRNNGNATAQTMVFEYGFGAAFTSVATWTAPGAAFNWTSPVASATAAAVDGNVAGRVNGVGGTVNSLAWAAGDTLWLRWIERNDTGNDHSLAIDDFTFSSRKPVTHSSVPDSLPSGWVGLAILSLFACHHWQFARRESSVAVPRSGRASLRH